MSDAQKKLVLVIEDDEEDLQKIMKIIEKEGGYCAKGARNGREGLKLAKELKPFAITLDIVMPGFDGWEVLMKLKSSPETKEIPVLIASRIAPEDSQPLKASDYLVKPIDEKRLLAALKKVEELQTK